MGDFWSASALLLDEYFKVNLIFDVYFNCSRIDSKFSESFEKSATREFGLFTGSSFAMGTK